MSLIIRESFDQYAQPQDLGYVWDFAYSADSVFVKLMSGTNTRFGVGQAYQWVSNFGDHDALYKRFGSNESVIFVVFAHFPAGLQGTGVDDFYIRLFDDTTVQCGIALASNGDIRVYQGNPSGTKTLLHTFTAAYSGLVWTQWQIKFILDGTNGEIRIRKDGSVDDDFVVTGLNLLTSANVYANAISIGAASSGISRTIDDLVIYSGDGAGAPWNDWVGDIRAQQLPPIADTAQKDFVPDTTSLMMGDKSTQSGGGNIVADTINYYQVTAPATGTLNASGTVIFYTPPGAGQHVNIALYDSDGDAGAPGTLLASGNITTNEGTIGSYLPYNFTFDTTVQVEVRRPYYWAVQGDHSFEIARDSGTQYPLYKEVRTYADGLPATATPSTNGTLAPVCIHMEVEDIQNYSAVAELIYDFDGSAIQGEAAGDFDLYQPQPMTVTPSAILGLSVRMVMKKTESEAREATVTIKSDSTEVDGRTIVLGSDYQLVDFSQDVDPATGEAWTPAAVNNLTFGPKVVG